MRFLFLSFLATVAVFAGSLNWLGSVDQARAVAKKENKPIMVFVEADHCHWCAKMLRETLEEKDTINVLNRDYVLVKLDIESVDVQKYFSNTYMTPTTYFVTANMQELLRIDGFVNIDSFYWYLGDVDRKLKELRGK